MISLESQSLQTFIRIQSKNTNKPMFISTLQTLLCFQNREKIVKHTDNFVVEYKNKTLKQLIVKGMVNLLTPESGVTVQMFWGIFQQSISQVMVLHKV